jgi:hypothetical protein
VSGVGQGLFALCFAVVSAIVLPAAGIAALAPAFEVEALSVKNYRGKRVFLGLGVVWVLWGLGVAFESLVVSRAAPAMTSSFSPPAGIAVTLVLFAFVFGMIDDVWGSAADKGFRGHIQAAASGRLSTGALKLVGIVAASFVAGIQVSTARWLAQGWSKGEAVLALLGATVLIAGSANLLNLLDLRPGRALKGYLLLCVVPFAAWLTSASSAGTLRSGTVMFALAAAAVTLAGPVFAVWRLDLSERGMLGDAGANAAGALAGLALAHSLPLVGVLVAAAVVVLLNLLSEVVSFSALIEKSAALAWFDSLGRLPEGGTKGGGKRGSQH